MRIQFIQDIIDTLRGKRNIDYSRKIYSQDGEDAVLYSYIMYDKKTDYKGFYIDIGALHPERFSNTNIFYQMGWRGINIDGTPNSMQKFNKLRPEDKNIETVVSTDNGEILYYIFEEPALNTFNQQCAEHNIAQGYKLKEKKNLKTQRINDILDSNVGENQKIDFITIDVEGVDEQIITTLDYNKYAPEYFIVEECEFKYKDFANYKGNSRLYKILSSKNYIVVGKTMRSIIYKNNCQK